jgi:hypothetical protein
VKFRETAEVESSPMAAERPSESRLQALIKLEVACRLALESLPELPPETEAALREPIQTLCTVTGRELENLQPGLSAERDAELS